MSTKKQHTNIVLVTGPSGAGRSTAIKVFEDIGYETIDNIPLSLLPKLLLGQPNGSQMALGVDIRTRDFNVGTILDIHEEINRTEGFHSTILFLDCDTDVLVRRYSETRRRHPLLPDDAPEFGIAEEKKILSKLRTMTDTLIDTTKLSPHDLKGELIKWYGDATGGHMSITLHSFSYKRGAPRGVDMTFDCRFLKNPYWDKSLRDLNGLDNRVVDYVKTDDRFPEFFDRLSGLCGFLLPAYIDEGKAHFSIGLGCTGGQHRSVCVTEALGKSLADSGWHVSIRHRELERQ